MKIIKARENQYEAVRAFYHSLIDGMKEFPYNIGWEKDIYPAPEFLWREYSCGDGAESSIQ